MWSASEAPFRGRHYTLERTLNSPQPLQQPHPPIMIGGGGERKTLRLVAQYAQACNLFAGPELERKLDVLREHCAAVGRSYDDIEKTVMMPFDVGPDGAGADAFIAQLQHLHELGVEHVHGRLADVARITPLEVFGEKIIPAAAGMGG
jgi:alkanesulfonate monooxygenase SsuD/methylene tetrahydromethanopterin reductase-like flavin-dependent oxidoreductase (luciferase family)